MPPPPQPPAASAMEGNGLLTHLVYARRMFLRESTGMTEGPELPSCLQDADGNVCHYYESIGGVKLHYYIIAKKVTNTRVQKEHSAPQIISLCKNREDGTLIRRSWTSKTLKIYFFNFFSLVHYFSLVHVVRWLEKCQKDLK